MGAGFSVLWRKNSIFPIPIPMFCVPLQLQKAYG